MTRKQLIDLAYRQDNNLSTGNTDYLKCLKRFSEASKKEDIGRRGDITSRMLITNKKSMAVVKAQEHGVIAGVEEASWFARRQKLIVKAYVSDGQRVNKGKKILEVKGYVIDLLESERTILNLMQRMSGVATETHALVKAAKPMTIAATRKTPWGLLDNKAVSLGGGATHRLGLWQAILIKDNHLKEISIEQALQKARKYKGKTAFVEIEVENIKQAIRAAEEFCRLGFKVPQIIMLDNFSPSKIRQTVKTLKEKELYIDILIEASGGITPENISKYAKSGADVASLGHLTHSSKVLDLNMKTCD